MRYGAIFLALALMVGSAEAAVVNWSASLSPDNEVPPAASPGANGSAAGTVDTATGLLTWDLSWSGLTGPTTAAHFHLGPVGVNGPVKLEIFIVPSTSPSSGSGMMAASDIRALLAGDVYINVHTEDFPGGEIRGQIAPVPLPATLPLLLAAGGILAFARRRKA